jgi:hypothetical protein
MRGAAVDGVNLVAERTRSVALPLTPLEYGDLRSSLTVQPANELDTTIEAAVSSDLPYAVRQHEDLHLRHDDGQAKFLETAAIRVGKTEAERIIATSVSRRLGA